jgi:hypothetical protein
MKRYKEMPFVEREGPGGAALQRLYFKRIQCFSLFSLSYMASRNRDPTGGSKLSLIGAKSVLWRELSGPGRRGWRPRRERIWLEGGAVLLGRSGQRLASDRWLRNFRRPARHRLFHALCAFSCWTAASRCLDASPNAPTISSAVLILGGPLCPGERMSLRFRSSLHCRQALTQFSMVPGPPRPRGMRWSTVAWSGAISPVRKVARPHQWHILSARSHRIVRRGS